MNITQIEVLGEEWDSDIITSVYDSLTQNTTNANSGTILGNRMFFDNDYMVRSIRILQLSENSNARAAFSCSAETATSPLSRCSRPAR
jgi:hypothetical protein